MHTQDVIRLDKTRKRTERRSAALIMTKKEDLTIRISGEQFSALCGILYAGRSMLLWVIRRLGSSGFIIQGDVWQCILDWAVVVISYIGPY